MSQYIYIHSNRQHQHKSNIKKKENHTIQFKRREHDSTPQPYPKLPPPIQTTNNLFHSPTYPQIRNTLQSYIFIRMYFYMYEENEDTSCAQGYGTWTHI